MSNETIKNFSVDVTEAKKFEVPEIKDGVYDAVLTDMELKTNLPDGKGGSFDMLQWNFEVNGKTINGKTSTTVSNLSKAYQWISSLTGKEPSGKFTPSMVEGKNCQVVIKHQKKERKFNNETQTLNMPYVHDVLPTK